MVVPHKDTSIPYYLEHMQAVFFGEMISTAVITLRIFQWHHLDNPGGPSTITSVLIGMRWERLDRQAKGEMTPKQRCSGMPEGITRERQGTESSLNPQRECCSADTLTADVWPSNREKCTSIVLSHILWQFVMEKVDIESGYAATRYRMSQFASKAHLFIS